MIFVDKEVKLFDEQLVSLCLIPDIFSIQSKKNVSTTVFDDNIVSWHTLY